MSIGGVQDVPLGAQDEDSLGLNKYALALARFIAGCKTPMSIGIQGDWGLGKTSLMQLVQQHLESGDKKIVGANRATCYWVNTWQLSQFDLGDQLSAVVLSDLVSALAEGNLKTRFLGKLKRLGQMGARALANAALSQVGASADGGEGEGTENPGKLIKELKEDFGKMCAAQCKSADDRVVIFIDDLDRLVPGRAVELMEVMKNFLDVPQAVFVLAIDYQVVVRGLKDKFGVAVRELGGRSFFDKIIQVPFRMPSQAYEVGNYLTSMLAHVGLSVGEGDVEEYVDLVRHSIGFNPRSIKRLCNNLLLLKLVTETSGTEADRRIADSSHLTKLLFATLCMQWSHPVLFQYVARDVSGERLSRLATTSELEQLISDGLMGDEDDRAANLLPFARAFYSVVDESGDGDLDKAELTALESILHVSVITSVTPPSEAEAEHILSSHARTFLEQWPPAMAEVVMELIAITRRSKDHYTFHRTRDGKLAARSGGYQFYLTPRDDKLLLIFEAVPEDDFEGMSCGDVFARLGHQSEHTVDLDGGYERHLNLLFHPDVDVQRALAHRLVQWWCIDYARPTDEWFPKES